MPESSSEPDQSGLLSLSNQFVPASYDLKLTIDHTKPNFNGSLTFDLVHNETFSKPEPEVFQITLHASKLILTGAVLKDETGESKLTISNDRKHNTVTLTAKTKSTSPKSVSIQYLGQINKIQTYEDKTHGLFKTNYLDTISGRSNNFVLATHFQPHSAKLVFPLIEEPHFKVPIKLQVETSTKFKVVSNSKLISNDPVSMSPNSLFVFEQTPPIASSVFGFVIGDFEFLETQVDDVPIRVYTAIGESSKASYALNLIKTFLPVLEDLLTHKYPLKKLDFVGIPFLSDGAMENWGMVTVLSNQLLLEEEETATFEQKYQLQQLIAHELVHQWIGNLVSFDDWTSLWFNEAFATWLGNYAIEVSKINEQDSNYDVQEIQKYESFFDKDCYQTEDGPAIQSLHQYISTINTGSDASTSTIFETNSYEKGMILLRMIACVLQADHSSTDNINQEHYSRFLEGIAKVISEFKYKSIKPFELWNTLNEFTTIDLLSFAHSWTRYPGFPLVSVKTNETNDKLVFEQHRYLYDLTPEQANLEDHPFHLPLLIKIVDDKGALKVVNVIMTDRTLELDIPTSSLVCVNNRRGGYYRTVYSRALIEQSIIPQISKNNVSAQDLISIINDYSKVLGTPGSDDKTTIAVFQILDALAHPEWILDYRVLQVALSYLETFNNIFMHFSDYSQFQIWLDRFILKLYRKIGNWNSLTTLTSKYSVTEIQVRNSVLQFGIANPEFQEVAKKLFKNFLSSGINKAYTPQELLSSIFNLTIYNGTQKEYKRILEFVKNSDTSLLRNSNISNRGLQTVALTSLCFTNNQELLNKSLNFVMTNIDSKLIELGLIGFQHKPRKQDKLRLFQWYSLHYDQWVRRSLRKGSDWSKQMAATVGNISTVVLGEIMQHDAELVDKKRKFIEQKLAGLPPHGLTELVEASEDKNIQKLAIGNLYSQLVEVLG